METKAVLLCSLVLATFILICSFYRTEAMSLSTTSAADVADTTTTETGSMLSPATNLASGKQTFNATDVAPKTSAGTENSDFSSGVNEFGTVISPKRGSAANDGVENATNETKQVGTQAKKTGDVKTVTQENFDTENTTTQANQKASQANVPGNSERENSTIQRKGAHVEVTVNSKEENTTMPASEVKASSSQANIPGNSERDNSTIQRIGAQKVTVNSKEENTTMPASEVKASSNVEKENNTMQEYNTSGHENVTEENATMKTDQSGAQGKVDKTEDVENTTMATKEIKSPKMRLDNSEKTAIQGQASADGGTKLQADTAAQQGEGKNATMQKDQATQGNATAAEGENIIKKAKQASTNSQAENGTAQQSKQTAKQGEATVNLETENTAIRGDPKETQGDVIPSNNQNSTQNDVTENTDVGNTTSQIDRESQMDAAVNKKHSTLKGDKISTQREVTKHADNMSTASTDKVGMTTTNTTENSTTETDQAISSTNSEKERTIASVDGQNISTTAPIPLTPKMVSVVDKCRQDDNCNLPSCFCPTFEHFMPREQIPQIVYFGIDDEVQKSYKEYFDTLFDTSRKNPNGCPISMTLFVSHINTDYKLVKYFHDKGNEIASHSINHKIIKIKTSLIEEARKQKENIAKLAGIPDNHVTGWRSPFIEPAGDVQVDVLQMLGYNYDISHTYIPPGAPTTPTKDPFPFTLDHSGWPFICQILSCPGRKHPGFWEVPINVLADPKQTGLCAFVDSCGQGPGNSTEVFDYLWNNFEVNYKGNRAPFGVHVHARWFHTSHNLQGVDMFIKELLKKKDIYIVNIQKMLAWMQNPTEFSNLGTYEPWLCGKAQTSESSNVPEKEMASESPSPVSAPKSVSSNESCQQEVNCKLPECFCPTFELPLNRTDIPQIVYFGFDDAVMWSHKRYFDKLFSSSRTNPDGCIISMYYIDIIRIARRHRL